MNRILIIADDFTGALDTGVQFSQNGVSTVVIKALEEIGSIGDEVQVVVINASTRHMSAEDSFNIVRAIVEKGLRSGFEIIYKKTDSGLRGNVGAELSACIANVDNSSMYFIPAFPQMKRVTVDGIQYIDGVPVSESVFGKDPFNPVTDSSVVSILNSQSKGPVYLNDFSSAPGIHVFDASSDEDIERIVEKVGITKPFFAAGCAGFASILSKYLNLNKVCVEKAGLPSKLLVICGSLNDVSSRQLEYAEVNGIERVSLPPRQRLDLSWTDADARNEVAHIMTTVEKTDCMIVDVGSASTCCDLQLYLESTGNKCIDLRCVVAKALAKLTETVLDNGFVGTILCIGGDTLQAILEQVDATRIKPICEVFPGVVQTEVTCRFGNLSVLTKSGGFGNRGLIVDVFDQVKGAKHGNKLFKNA